MTSSRIRVALVDDHAMVRQGLRMLLEADPELEVVGEAANRAGAFSLVASSAPDIVLVDLVLGGDSGLDVIADLRARYPDTRVLVLTGLREPQAHRQALQAGASGIVEKEAAPEVLLKAIRRVSEGEAWVDRRMTASILAGYSSPSENQERARIQSLSSRESELVALIGEGLSNKGIADRLSISEITVRHHLSSIYRKLQIRDRLELLLYAYKHKLIPPPA